MPYATSIATSSRDDARGEPRRTRGRRPAPAATQPHAKAWNGVQGPIPPQNTDDKAIVRMPRSSPNRAPYARPARINRMKTASMPPTPVLAIRTAAPTAVSTPSSATV